MEDKRKLSLYQVTMIIIVTMLITFMITFIIFQGLKKGGYIYITSDNPNLSVKLSAIEKIIKKQYLGEINEEDLIEGAIKGYVAGLDDPYSEYIPKKEVEDFEIETLGNYVGIGIYMTVDTKTNAVMILSPIKDTPAFEAGILPGDIILKIDDVSYDGSQMTDAANKIKGEVGTKVKLEIKRKEEILTFEIERKNIKVAHVEAQNLENNIGYLEISTFDEGCSIEFEEKFKQLQEKNIKSLIIDLRNNGGGIVEEAEAIANLIVDKGSILKITTNKDGNEEMTKSTKEPIINIPIIVLINENTASASEILVGALKDNLKAQIVGTTTYGKGVIQQYMELYDGSGLKITINEYYTPNKNKINDIGIEPNTIVELPEEIENSLKIPIDKDTQLQKAIELLKAN